MIVNFLKYSNNFKSILNRYDINTTDESIFDRLPAKLKLILEDIEKQTNDDASSLNAEDLLFEDGELSFLEDTQENSSELFGLLNDLIEQEDVQEILDTDKDGEISNDEMNAFLSTIQEYDEDAQNISINDIFSALTSMEDGTFEEDLLKASGLETVTPEEANEINAKSTNNYKGSTNGATGGTYNPTNADGANTVKEATLEELEAEKEAQETKVKEAQEKVQEVYSGENEAVKNAQDDCDKNKEAYEEALKNDENLSQELKDRQNENQTNIDEKKALIDSINSNISAKQNQITAQKSIITADESNIQALEAAISDLNSQTSTDAEEQADIASKLQTAEANLTSAKAKLASDKQTLAALEGEKAALEKNLSDEEAAMVELEEERETIKGEILANCGEETKIALEAFEKSQANVETVKAQELEAAKTAETEAQTKLDEINAQINVKKAQEVKKEFSVNSLDNPEKLYETMGLEAKGLNKEVFLKAIEGYNNLEDKGNGCLGIFDTTQGANAERYYLLDLNTFELIGQSAIKTGSGDMSDVEKANQSGSKATLSGFEKVAEEYKSSKKWKVGIRLDGLEEGINDNARSKSTVAHYTTGNSTWGCKGITPVYKNGKVDESATFKKLRTLFPTDAIIFTYPTDPDYWTLSDLY